MNDVLLIGPGHDPAPSSCLPPAERLIIATWNVNSLRPRLEQVARLVKAETPDVLCLQETKVANDLFPYRFFADLGYVNQAITGMKGYNGVAILSRQPLAEVQSLSWVDRDDCRHLAAKVALRDLDPVEIHNFYFPAGGDRPDAEINPKFAHKLAFLHQVEQWFLACRSPRDPLVLVGDLNVAPLETDVYDHSKLSRIITHTPVEIQHLLRIQASLEWIDVARTMVPPEAFLFTWWSYRQRGDDWRAANRGRRLDHLWVTPALRSAVRTFQVITDARGWKPPSDHAPVVMTLHGQAS